MNTSTIVGFDYSPTTGHVQQIRAVLNSMSTPEIWIEILEMQGVVYTALDILRKLPNE